MLPITMVEKGRRQTTLIHCGGKMSSTPCGANFSFPFFPLPSRGFASGRLRPATGDVPCLTVVDSEQEQRSVGGQSVRGKSSAWTVACVVKTTPPLFHCSYFVLCEQPAVQHCCYSTLFFMESAFLCAVCILLCRPCQLRMLLYFFPRVHKAAASRKDGSA